MSLAARIGALVVLLACACGRTTIDTPNIILIVMDTARADHMSCYGYHRPVTPRIDEFTQGATFYTRAMAPSSWTIPSHASLFTGKDPFEHGAHNVEGDGRKRYDNLNALDEGHLTLAEALSQTGYLTGAVIANDAYLMPRFQLDQGFQVYDVDRAYSPEVNERVFAWLDSAAANPEPFFLFINYFDTHVIYNTSPRSDFLPTPVVGDRGVSYSRLRDAILARRDYPQRLRQRVIDQYDTAFANLDEQIGLLFDELKGRGLYDQSLIVLTSDHGEAFGEHEGVATHGTDVYQELLWIPLIIKAPGQQAHRQNKKPTSLSDVPQIIFSKMGRAVVRGFRDEFPNKPGKHLLIGENYYARPKHRYHRIWGDHFDRIRIAAYDWPHKYIESTDGHSELYDLENDPQELINLKERKPKVAEKILDRLVEYRASRPHGDDLVDPGTPSDDELERLRSLGYVDN